MASKRPPSTSQDRKKDAGTDTNGKAEKLTQEEQSARFIETARELESDESGKAFEKAIKQVAGK